MTKFTLKHPIVSGLAIWIATTLAAFGLGLLWLNYIVIPDLLKSQNPNLPSDVAGMGSLAAFLVIVIFSSVLGFVAGLIGTIALFVFRRGTNKKP